MEWHGIHQAIRARGNFIQGCWEQKLYLNDAASFPGQIQIPLRFYICLKDERALKFHSKAKSWEAAFTVLLEGDFNLLTGSHGDVILAPTPDAKLTGKIFNDS